MGSDSDSFRRLPTAAPGPTSHSHGARWQATGPVEEARGLAGGSPSRLPLPTPARGLAGFQPASLGLWLGLPARGSGLVAGWGEAGRLGLVGGWLAAWASPKLAGLGLVTRTTPHWTRQFFFWCVPCRKNQTKLFAFGLGVAKPKLKRKLTHALQLVASNRYSPISYSTSVIIRSGVHLSVGMMVSASSAFAGGIRRLQCVHVRTFAKLLPRKFRRARSIFEMVSQLMTYQTFRLFDLKSLA